MVTVVPGSPDSPGAAARAPATRCSICKYIIFPGSNFILITGIILLLQALVFPSGNANIVNTQQI